MDQTIPGTTPAEPFEQDRAFVGRVFISHASADDALVNALRLRLEDHGIPVWVDSRRLRGGDKLAPEVESAIEAAPKVLVVLSAATVNSPWVRREVRKALEVEGRRKADGYRVIPILLPGITPGELGAWFVEEPLAVPVRLGYRGLDDALPDILTALGKRLPEDREKPIELKAPDVEELVLALEDPKIESAEGKRRVRATATVTCIPAQAGAPRVESKRFSFVAPLGPIEAEDLRWYLESYYIWPVGVFRARAEAIEGKLPGWGHELYKATVGSEAAREALEGWKCALDGTDLRFSVVVHSDPPEVFADDDLNFGSEAAAELLALPWEILHDGGGWMFQGARPVRVCRRLPSRKTRQAGVTGLPVRILLLSPRPERGPKGDPVGYIDHRASAGPLVEAVEKLGDLVRLTVLSPPTYPALKKALVDAEVRGEPFHVVHFDGHGRAGALCFEDPRDEDRLEGRRMELIDAVGLAALFLKRGVPLAFLDACQTAVAEANPAASVAARLLEGGIASVVAMSRSVLVETARRFVGGFYRAIAEGSRVGSAMLGGQRALFGDSARGKVLGAGDLRLQDWFVPVLYQERTDPQLIGRLPAKVVRRLEARRREASLGELPSAPRHRFQGRSRELLALERLLGRERWTVVRGAGGVGKTALAVELVRWLVRTGRFGRAAFASLERCHDARAVLDALGHQLLPEGKRYSVAQFKTLDEALQPVKRALQDRPTAIVLDNAESVLPPAGAVDPALGEEWAGIAELCGRLLEADPATRVIFTSREPLPEPFDGKGRERELGALERRDAIELVGRVMAEEGLEPAASDSGGEPKEVEELVEAVGCHARALVLLAREVARRGVRAATQDLRSLMADLERKHPGDRENSLYASVELSLRRLSAGSRERVRALAVCHGAVHVTVLRRLTGLTAGGARALAMELIDVGLGEDMGRGHLRLDPGLPPYLLWDLGAEEIEALRGRWAEAMALLTAHLNREQFKDAQTASDLTRLELPSLVGMLEWIEDRWTAELVIELAKSVETLVAFLGRPQALSVARRVREAGRERLEKVWGHSQYLAGSAEADRLFERGELRAARESARRLLDRCEAAGESAYPEAAFDLAGAHFQLGRVLQWAGEAKAALEQVAEARRRFERLAAAVGPCADLMVGVCLTETSVCLRALGRLDEAAAACEQSMEIAKVLSNRRGWAVAKGQLGAVRMDQRRDDEALQMYEEARATFEALDEPLSVAAMWHQIGIVHHLIARPKNAEDAYREALAIRVREGNLAGEAESVGQLGRFCKGQGRLQEAAAWYRRAIDIWVRLGDATGEGRSRSDLAETLCKLGSFDEARQEILPAIKGPIGDSGAHWNLAILAGIEEAAGNPAAARAARRGAIESYFAYRRAGGVSQSNRWPLFDRAERAIRESNTGEVAKLLTQHAARPDARPSLKALAAKLQAVLAGSRDPSLAEDPALAYMDAVELRLLLERLAP